MKKLLTITLFSFLSTLSCLHAGTNASLPFNTNTLQVPLPGFWASNAAAIAAAQPPVYHGTTNILFISPNGSDLFGNGTNYPFLTVTNALATANALAANGATVVVSIPPGTYPVQSNTFVSNNVSIIGAGRDVTFLTYYPPLAWGNNYLQLYGSNIVLSGFTIGTNPNTALHGYALSAFGPTNVIWRNLKIIGDSDCASAQLYTGNNLLVDNCDFISGFDHIMLDGLTAPYSNINVTIKDCYFGGTIDTNFTNATEFHSIFDISANVTARNCTFAVINTTGKPSRDVELSSAGAGSLPLVILENNLHTSSGAGTVGLYLYNSNCTANISGGYDPGVVQNTNHGTVNWGNAQFFSLSATYNLTSPSASIANFNGVVNLGFPQGSLVTENQSTSQFSLSGPSFGDFPCIYLTGNGNGIELDDEVYVTGTLTASALASSNGVAVTGFSASGFTNTQSTSVRVWNLTGTNLSFTNFAAHTGVSLPGTNGMVLLNLGEAVLGTNCHAGLVTGL